MGFLSVVVAYAMRTCLSVAITEMVISVTNTKDGNKSIVCNALYSTTDLVHDDYNGARSVSKSQFVVQNYFPLTDHLFLRLLE